MGEAAQDLRLEQKFVETALGTISQSGEFSGYASLFGIVDLGKESVEAGAFTQSLKRRSASGIRMLYQHNPDEVIGHWTKIAEDARGLSVRGKLNLEVARAREIHALMQDGSIDGLSIGFKTVRSRSSASSGVRHILEADLWEISIVTFPMLPQARITDVKSGTALPTTREFERWLVRDAGLTRSQARQVITKGYQSLGRARDARGSGTDEAAMPVSLAAKIRRAAALLQSH